MSRDGRHPQKLPRRPGGRARLCAASDGEGGRVDRDALGAVPVRELEHVVAQRDDDELRVARALLDVVAHDGDVAEVERRVDLIHHVERRRLVVVERKDERERRERLLASREVGDVLPRLLGRPYREDDALGEGVERVDQLQLGVAAQAAASEAPRTSGASHRAPPSRRRTRPAGRATQSRVSGTHPTRSGWGSCPAAPCSAHQSRPAPRRRRARRAPPRSVRAAAARQRAHRHPPLEGAAARSLRPSPAEPTASAATAAPCACAP
eukprot:scaffold7006_cov108-Isochrysis_galbana.AAC.8